MKKEYSDYIKNFENHFYYYYINKGYTLSPNYPLISENDSSLLFINSTIAVYKHMLNSGENIIDYANIQDCFRFNSDIDNSNFSILFKMLGCVGMKSSGKKMLSDILDFISISLGVDKNNLFIVSLPEKDLTDIAYSVVPESNVKIIKENSDAPHFSTLWTYGKNFDICGKGLTIAYRNPHIQKCSDTCSVICENCKKHIQLGNLIVIHNKKNDSEYIELGVGLERLISIKFNNDMYNLPGIKTCIDNIVKKCSLSNSEAKTFINLYKAIYKLFDQNVVVSNKKQGYILKKLLRELVIRLLITYDMHLNDSISDYIIDKHTELYKNVYYLEYYIEDRNNNLVVDFIKKYINNLMKNIRIINNKKISINEQFNTFGISETIISQMIVEKSVN